MLRGDMSQLDCDCIAEMTFENIAHFQAFYKKIYEKENAALLARDEEMFLQRGATKVIVVGETWSTDESGVSTLESDATAKSERSNSDASGHS
jgi:hypothetical protein